MYINSSVTPSSCNCEQVVLVHVNMSRGEADSFCPRCRCEYQTRNLSVIKVVVILVIWVISILVVYMGFLSCLEPVLNRRGGAAAAAAAAAAATSSASSLAYVEQRDDDDEERLTPSSRSNSTPMSTYPGSSVVSRVGTQQSRWKRQVQEQRRNIYDRHSMLN